MPKFKVTVLEHRNYSMEIEAADEEAAMRDAKTAYDNTLAMGTDPAVLYPNEIALVEAIDAEPVVEVV